MKPLVVFMHPEDDPTLLDASIRAQTERIEMSSVFTKGEAIVLDTVELERQVRRDMERIFCAPTILEEPPSKRRLPLDLAWMRGLTA